MKPWKNGSVNINLSNFVLVIFYWKMLNDLAFRLMKPISRLLSIQIIIAQHMRFQRSSIKKKLTLKKKRNSIYGLHISLRKFMWSKAIASAIRLKPNEIDPFVKRLFTESGCNRKISDDTKRSKKKDYAARLALTLINLD